MTLRRSIIAATALALSAHQVAPTPISTRQSDGATVSASLRGCLAQSGVDLSYPYSPDYGTLDTLQNAAIDAKKPGVFTLPTSEDEVKKVVKCVADEGGDKQLSTRSGGHGYAGYALGSKDGWVVVDLKNMNQVTDVDKDAKTAKVGAGSRLGPMALALAKDGFALPHGTCPSVGTGGHALGGGYGYTSRAWGYLMDHIVEMRLVKPDGSAVTVNESEEPDLWFALRGAGSNNYGVVTEFTFKLEDAPTKVVNYGHNYGSDADCAQVMIAMQDLTNGAGDDGWISDLGGELLVSGESNNGNAPCALNGQFLGSKEDFQKSMARLNDAIEAKGVKASKAIATEFDSWTDALTDLMGNLSTSTYSPEAYYAKSLLTPTSVRYDEDSYQAIASALSAAVDYGTSYSFAFLGPNAATNSVPSNSSALVHRNVSYIGQIYMYSFPENNDDGKQDAAYAAAQKVVDAAKAVDASAQWSGYINYIDPQLLARGEDWGQFYYGDAVEKLRKIKSTVDPYSILDFPMGITHAASR